MTESIWSFKPQIFTIWPFTESLALVLGQREVTCCHLLSQCFQESWILVSLSDYVTTRVGKVSGTRNRTRASPELSWRDEAGASREQKKHIITSGGSGFLRFQSSRCLYMTQQVLIWRQEDLILFSNRCASKCGQSRKERSF